MRKLKAGALLIWGVAFVGLVQATARAAPGGGTDDFGGGGGGGGSGSSGGGGSGGGGSGGGGGYTRPRSSDDFGSGSDGSGGGDPGAMWAVAVIVGLVMLGFWLYQRQQQALAGDGGDVDYRHAPRQRPSRIRAMGPSRAARRERQQKVELAAEEARADDEAFAPETVKARGAELHKAIVAAWTGRDRAALEGLLSPELFAEWKLRLDDFDRKGWHNITELRDEPGVEYLGLVNREGDDEDRVVVRVEALLRDYVVDTFGTEINRKDESDKLTTLSEYWVLGKRASADDEEPGREGRGGGGGGRGQWVLLSTEQDAEGGHHIESAIIAAPWGDDTRIRDEAATELGVARTVPDGLVGDVADFDFGGDARTAALDLASVDGRFSPDVLEAAVRRAVAAWAEAVDGEDASLLAVTTAEAAAELLYPGDPDGRVRVVVRGPVVRKITIVGLDGTASPPTMRVEAEVSGRRYLQDRNTTAVVTGSKDEKTTFTERWTFALDGADETPWRLSAGQPSTLP